MIVLCHRSRRLDVDSMSIAGEHPNEFTRLWEGNNSADRRLRLASGVAASHVEQTYATPRRFDVDRGTIDFLHAMSLTASSRARWIGRARVAGAEQHLALWSLKSRRLTTVSISAARQRNRRRLSTSSKTSRSDEGEPTARYERAPVPTAFTPFGARVRMIPVEHLQMPAPLVLSVCRLDRVPYPATGATCAGAARLPTAGPDGSPPGRPGTGAVRCVVAAEEDRPGGRLKRVAAGAGHRRGHSRYITGRMMQPRRTEGCCWARGSGSGSSSGRTWVIWHNGTVAAPLRADRPRRGRAPAFRKTSRTCSSKLVSRATSPPHSCSSAICFLQLSAVFGDQFPPRDDHRIVHYADVLAAKAAAPTPRQRQRHLLSIRTLTVPPAPGN